MKKKQYQRAFCIICKNRTASLKEGVICGLTNELPNFENKCKEFKVDPKEINKKTTKLKKEITKNYLKQDQKNFLTDPERSIYVERNEIKNNLKRFPNKGINMTFSRNKFNLKNNLLGFIGILLMIIYGNIKHNHGWDIKSYSMIFLIAYVFIGIIIISYGYFNDKKYIISFNENYININGLKLYWNNILDYVIIQGRNDDTIILFTALNGVEKINMYRFDNSALDIASIIEDNKKNPCFPGSR